MDNLIFNYNKMLSCLNTMELDINTFDKNSLKKKHRLFSKKYHPDANPNWDYQTKINNAKLFNKYMECYEYLDFCLENKFLWQDKIDSNNTYRENTVYYQDLTNRLDVIIRSINPNNYSNKVIKYIIDTLLIDIDTLKQKTNTNDIIFDYGTISNYCELIELFIKQVLNININSYFNKDKNNYLGNNTDKYFKEKSELCYLEKILLYGVITKIISFINDEGKYLGLKIYKKKIKKYLLLIDEITNDIYSFKWLLTLPSINNEKINIELNKIKSRRK